MYFQWLSQVQLATHIVDGREQLLYNCFSRARRRATRRRRRCEDKGMEYSSVGGIWYHRDLRRLVRGGYHPQSAQRSCCSRHRQSPSSQSETLALGFGWQRNILAHLSGTTSLVVCLLLAKGCGLVKYDRSHRQQQTPTGRHHCMLFSNMSIKGSRQCPHLTKTGYLLICLFRLHTYVQGFLMRLWICVADAD